MKLENKNITFKAIKAKIYRQETHIGLARLMAFVLAFALIGGYVIWHSFAAENLVATVEAESATLTSGSQVLYNDSSASGTKLVKMSQNGTSLSKSFTLPSSTEIVEVIARTNSCSSGWPSMSLLIDNTQAGSWSVTASNWTKYRVSKSLLAGGHTLSIKLTGQTSCPYLYVDAINFYGVTPDTTLLSQNKTAAASSVYSAGQPSAAFDGDPSTRWSSMYSDPQWLSVDLGFNTTVTEVKLNWETAYGKSYEIQASADNVNWTTIYSTTTGDGNIDDLTNLTGSGRYVRLYGTQRATQWGYSLYEMQVYGVMQVAPLPTVTLSASPAIINANGTSKLSWSSTDATTCSASGAWSGTKLTAGSETVGPLTQTSSYTLSCTGSGGTSSAKTTVTVNAPTATSSIYWGAYMEGDITMPIYYGPTDPYGKSWQDAPFYQTTGNTWDRFELDAGKKVSVLHFGSGGPPWVSQYSTFPSQPMNTIISRGAIPLLGMTTGSTALRDIAAGKYDTYLKSWAAGAKTWGKPFILNLDPEMNGNWEPYGPYVSGKAFNNGNTPAEFISMYRHFHDVVAAIAPNVTWGWTPNVGVSDAGRVVALQKFFPGNAYVDWTGLDGYNQVAGWYQSFSNIFKASYDMITSDSTGLAPAKPMLIAEFASMEYAAGGETTAGTKAAWIKDTFETQLPKYFPKIKMAVWFNWHFPQTFEIQSSTYGKAAFKKYIASPYYAANNYGNLPAGTKIQPLP